MFRVALVEKELHQEPYTREEVCKELDIDVSIEHNNNERNNRDCFSLILRLFLYSYHCYSIALNSVSFSYWRSIYIHPELI